MRLPIPLLCSKPENIVPTLSKQERERAAVVFVPGSRSSVLTDNGRTGEATGSCAPSEGLTQPNTHSDACSCVGLGGRDWSANSGSGQEVGQIDDVAYSAFNSPLSEINNAHQ